MLTADGIDIKVTGSTTPAASWRANRMEVPEFIGKTVTLANHQLTQYNSGTIVRATPGA